MSEHSLIPADIVMENGIAYRRFLLDGEEVYKLNLNRMMGHESTQESELMCRVLENRLNIPYISVNDLVVMIKTRKIVKED